MDPKFRPRLARRITMEVLALETLGYTLLKVQTPEALNDD